MKSLYNLFAGKIRGKIFAAILIVLMCSVLTVGIFSHSILMRAFTGHTYRELYSVADTVNTLIPDSGSYYVDLYALAENRNVNFEIVDPSGFLSYTTRGSGSALSSDHFSAPGSSSPEYSEMIASVNSYKSYDYDNFEVKKRLATNADYFIYTCSLSTGDTLHVYSPVADVESVVDIANGVYSIFSISILVIVGIIFLIVSSRFTRPVEEINDVTKDMAALDFSRKCEDYGKDEIGELGRSINTLSDTLDATLEDLKQKNEQLEKDIELRLALDNARKSFISNVSHELKTPLAIISGYAEGLCAGIGSSPETIKEYCGIINDESKRMNELVLELLELTRLESKSYSFSPDYCDLGEIIKSQAEHFSLQAEQNGITIENRVPLSLECFAQEDRIEIVIKNYLSNAISHCDGEKKIIIDYEDKPETVAITVYNTGEHIAPEDMPEIWDSFYRADKSHERSENRYGLGLSIVKSIMTNHRCAYSAENTAGGVKFSFEVAKTPEYYENKENEKQNNG